MGCYCPTVSILSENMINVIGPERIGLIYTKYTYSYYGIYLLFYMCYAKSINFIESLMDFSIFDDILDTILIIDKSYYILNTHN